MNPPENQWTQVIKPSNKWWDLKFKEIWQYRDLIMIFVIRDFKASYKQTILGPTWFILQPLMTTLVSMFLFGKIANLSEDGTPQFLFFFCSISLWSFVSSIIQSTSRTFTSNAGLFSKIYYPRLITPISTTLSATLRLLIPFGIFIACWLFYYFFLEVSFQPTIHLLLVPVYILLFVIIGNSVGIIIASLTTKYRDLQMFVAFGLQLLMYLSAVQYSMSKTPPPFDRYLGYNPLVPIMESCRYAFFGSESTMHDLSKLGWTAGSAVVLFFFSLILFNRVEKNFIDTV